MSYRYDEVNLEDDDNRHERNNTRKKETRDAKCYRQFCSEPCYDLWYNNPIMIIWFLIAVILIILLGVYVIPPSRDAYDNAGDLNNAQARSARQSFGITDEYDPSLTWSSYDGQDCCNAFSLNLLAAYIGRDQQSFCNLECSTPITGSVCQFTNITQELVNLPVRSNQIILQQPIASCSGNLYEVCNGQPSCQRSVGLPLDATAWSLPDPADSYTPPCNQFTEALFANALAMNIRNFCNATLNIPNASCNYTSKFPQWVYTTVSTREIILQPCIDVCGGNVVCDVFLGESNSLNITGSV